MLYTSESLESVIEHLSRLPTIGRKTAQRVARAVQAVFDPPGLTLLQANGREGDQTVFHFHLHVVPRHGGDGIALSWPRKEPGAEVLRGYAERLRAVLVTA